VRAPGQTLVTVVLALASLAVLTAPVLAQCSMCQQVIVQSPEAQKMSSELNRAILLMFVAHIVFTPSPWPSSGRPSCARSSASSASSSCLAEARRAGLSLADLPTLNAVLNGSSAVFLALGFAMIRAGRREAHRRLMLAAVTTSALFLVSYLVYHFEVGSVRFARTGPIRSVYLVILGTHTVLAAAIVPLVLVTLARALAGIPATNTWRESAPLWPTFP
jgi:uncharacterized membrane protein YozB (DUF420 family)